MHKDIYILGVILAGGRGKRMGGIRKGEIILANYSLAEWAFMGLSPQVDQIIVNAPSSHGLDAVFVPDDVPNLNGPLAGVLTALSWGRQNLNSPFAIVTVAVDTPFFPDDLVTKLNKGGAPALASIDGEAQSTFGYWPEGIENALKNYMKESKNPSIRGFAQKTDMRMVNFKKPNQFFNINTPEDLAKAEGLIDG